MAILGIDIGGSGIKGALVDPESGTLLTNRFRLDTPASRLPEAVLPVVQQVVEHFDYSGPLGVGFPAVVVDGVVKTPFTAIGITEWIGLNVAEQLADLTGLPTRVINDADAAGLAEMHFGAGKGHEHGVVIVLTLGTGIGSGLFYDGTLVPNTEFGKLYLRNRKNFVEYYAAERAREVRRLTWKAWATELDRLLLHLDHLFSPQLFILGGGVSKKHDRFAPFLTVPTPVVPALLRNEAGILGAAMAAPR